MNTHKNARLTFAHRLEMVLALTSHQLSVAAASRQFGVTATTVKKWLGRYLGQGQAGLADPSSRPQVSPRSIAPATALTICRSAQEADDAGPYCELFGRLQSHGEPGSHACRPGKAERSGAG